jgi:hypothetical protein
MNKSPKFIYGANDKLMAETIDARGDRAQAVNDYRVLKPRMAPDPNNRDD